MNILNNQIGSIYDRQKNLYSKYPHYSQQNAEIKKVCGQEKITATSGKDVLGITKGDKEASAAREKAYHDYVMQYEMAVAKQQSEAWRKAIDGVPDSLRMLLEINNTENVPEYSEKQKSNITMQSRLMIIPVTV